MELHWWILSGLSVAGVILNVYQIKFCFWIWLFSNGCWIIYTYRKRTYPLVALFATYFILAIWGIIQW